MIVDVRSLTTRTRLDILLGRRSVVVGNLVTLTNDSSILTRRTNFEGSIDLSNDSLVVLSLKNGTFDITGAFLNLASRGIDEDIGNFNVFVDLFNCSTIILSFDSSGVSGQSGHTSESSHFSYSILIVFKPIILPYISPFFNDPER